jgi:tRNA(Glu) U13 pseudouridine synthase TruD
MRLRPVRPVFRLIEGGDIELSFSLPRGAYATTLLGELAVLDEGRPARETNRLA